MTASAPLIRRQVSSRPTGLPPLTTSMQSPLLSAPHPTSRRLAWCLARHLVACSPLISMGLAQSQPLPRSTTAQQLNCPTPLAGAQAFPNAASSPSACQWNTGHFCVGAAAGRSMARPSSSCAGAVINPSLQERTQTPLATPGFQIAHHSSPPLQMRPNGSLSHSSRHLMNPSPLSTSQHQAMPIVPLKSSATSNPVTTTTAGCKSAWRFIQ